MKEITIPLPLGDIAALQFGNPNGPTIIAVHGWLDNAASFIPIAPYFKDFNLIAIDLPGHGMSFHYPKDVYFHYADYIPTITAVLDSLGLKQCSFLGHSLGAGILSIVAGVVPTRVAAMGLIDSLGPITVTPSKLPIITRQAITEYSKLRPKSPPKYQSIEEAITARLRATRMDPESVRILVDRGLEKVQDGYMWRTDQRLLFKPIAMYTEDQVAPFLKRIKAPTALVIPNKGLPAIAKMMEFRKTHVPNLQEITATGYHHVHMDNPQEVGEKLVRFFSKILL